TSDDLLFVYTDHALIGASHSDVRDVGGALREDALVSGRNMSVSSEHSGDPAIQIPAERNFLGGSFGVNVHENHFGLELIEQAIGGAEWVVIRGHKNPALQVDDRVGHVLLSPFIHA